MECVSRHQHTSSQMAGQAVMNSGYAKRSPLPTTRYGRRFSTAKDEARYVPGVTVVSALLTPLCPNNRFG